MDQMLKSTFYLYKKKKLKSTFLSTLLMWFRMFTDWALREGFFSPLSWACLLAIFLYAFYTLVRLLSRNF